MKENLITITETYLRVLCREETNKRKHERAFILKKAKESSIAIELQYRKEYYGNNKQ